MSVAGAKNLHRLCWIARPLPSGTLFFNSSLQLGLEAAIDGFVVRSDAEVVLIDPAPPARREYALGDRSLKKSQHNTLPECSHKATLRR